MKSSHAMIRSGWCWAILLAFGWTALNPMFGQDRTAEVAEGDAESTTPAEAVETVEAVDADAKETKTSGDREESELDQYLRLAREAYEKAVESGGKWAGGVRDWVREDFKKLGRWQYKVVDLRDTDAEALEAQLNELGRDRWECFWIHQERRSIRMIFKKPELSYLRGAPADDLLRLLP